MPLLVRIFVNVFSLSHTVGAKHSRGDVASPVSLIFTLCILAEPAYMSVS
jgi:hypothetical protein